MCAYNIKTKAYFPKIIKLEQVFINKYGCQYYCNSYQNKLHITDNLYRIQLTCNVACEN